MLCAQQIPLTWRSGTLTRVQSGQEYLGTYSTNSAAGGLARALSFPIVRTDQVYTVSGGGMEYVIVERNAAPAHVVINAPIAYATQGGQFYFADQEHRSHSARIADGLGKGMLQTAFAAAADKLFETGVKELETPQTKAASG